MSGDALARDPSHPGHRWSSAMTRSMLSTVRPRQIFFDRPPLQPVDEPATVVGDDVAAPDDVGPQDLWVGLSQLT